MLADAQGRDSGRPGQGFHCANMEPLLDRTAHSLIRKPSEILRDEPLCQSDLSNSYHHYPGTSTSASSPGQPLSFRLLTICTMVDLWRTWKEGVWGKIQWFSACRPLSKKVDR
jgi:hypothetical protein